jgi:ABC-type transport system substrate-binding protein
VTSADAAWSICRLVQPTAPTRWLFSNVRHELVDDGEKARCEGIRTDGPHSIEIEIDAEPDRLLPALASTPAAIVPEGSEAGEYGVIPGAGPYEVEYIEPNARVVLNGRQGGPFTPGFREVEFRLVQDDATATALFRAGELDVLEIGNPTLYRLLVEDGEPRLPGRLLSSPVDQVRLLIFNEAKITDRLGVSESETREWISAFTARIDVEAIAQRFSPLLIPMHTSYFPAYESEPEGMNARHTDNTAKAEPRSVGLTIVTENDPFSDSLAAAITREAGIDRIDYIGLEKSVLISRLINREYEIASITLEAQVHHPAYWLSFFRPGSPFTVFGTPIEGLKGPGEPGATDHNRVLIDEKGNWFVLARERRFVLVQPRIGKLSSHATGLLNYATIETDG